MLLAAAVAVTGAATSFVPAQGAMVAIVPPVKSDVAADIVPVEAEWARQYRQYNQRRWYPRHGGGWDGRHGWRGGHDWDDDDWRWRHRRHGRRGHHFDDDNGAALALGLFGFAAGAFLGSQLHGGYGGHGGAYYGGASCGAYDRHDAACDQRFRSYDWCSNTYLGYDGDRHYC
jgi:hypothetical protein